MDTVEIAVSFEDATKFLETACRNWQDLRIGHDDVNDVAGALSSFLKSRLASRPTPAGDMVERVARALFAQAEAKAILGCSELSNDPSLWMTWDTANEPTREPYREMARAALEALSGEGERAKIVTSALPEYGHWLPDVWDAYLLELVGFEHKDSWARLPATFRWNDFHQRLSDAIALSLHSRGMDDV